MMPTDLRAPFFRKPWVRVRNGSGADIVPFGILRVTASTTDDGEIVYNVAAPSATFQRIYLVNGPVMLYDNNDGWATTLMQGGYIAYSSNTPAVGEEWGAASGSHYVTQNRPGFLITGTGDGSKVPAVQVLAQSIIGKADTAIANVASGTVRVYGGTQGSESDTGQTIASCYNYGPDIADESIVTVAWLHGKPYVSLLDCA